ncbi:MAG: IS1634 family transposase [Actinobacteria bacterium]|nr:IS1634 family transposase [Actinomycetota bacterium]
MTTPAVPVLPAGVHHESLEVGAAPVIRRFLERLNLPGLFDRHLPRLPGRQGDLPTSTVLSVLLSNLLLARQPLYGITAWAASFVPEHLGLLPAQAALLNDDRCGRALDHLFRADRASLLTAVALVTIRVFRLVLQDLHQDTTTVTVSGEYANQPPAEQTNRPARICHGHNKDHRPDLKQLLYNRTVTADGAVPIHCKIHDGNTSDEQVHKETWLALCQIVGSPDFLYVADSKLCNKRDMGRIAKDNGRFLTLMPQTRAEHGRFLAWVQDNQVDWVEVVRKDNPRGKDRPQVVYQGHEDGQGSQEGYRIFWYLSSQKQQRDYQARMKKLVRTRKRLQRLRPPGRGGVFKTEQAALEAAQRVLDKAKVQDWLRVVIEEVVQSEHVQVGRGRPGPNTLYKQVQSKSYKIRGEDNQEALRRAARCDGLFALMSNDKGLSVKQALEKYKYQPYAEKRHEQLKSVFEVRPVWLKNSKRVESLLWLYHLVELLQALVEREVRRQMEEAEIGSLPLYPEMRYSVCPTSELVLKVLAGHRRHRLLDGQGQEIYRFHDPVSDAAETLLDFLGIDRSAYGLS